MLKQEHIDILTECQARQREIKRRKIPDYEFRFNHLLCNERDFGPRYVPSEWFGDLVNKQRQAYLRAIGDLERAGLVEVLRSDGGRLTNLRLTAKGLKKAKSLLKGKK